jgi:hypothetical protein
VNNATAEANATAWVRSLFDVDIDGLFRDGQLVGDAAVAIVFGNLTRGFDFAFDERFVIQVFDGPRWVKGVMGT